MENFLRTHSRGIVFFFALIIALALSVATVRIPILPVADGEGYAMRAFALHGFLHTGQWTEFWELLARPKQSILPLHDLVFFLLPQGLAGTISYVLVRNFITFSLLGYAVFEACKVLGRPQWAPPIFLLCAVNNIALIDFYSFFLDVPFLSLGLLALALQMKAWKENRPLVSGMDGLVVGLLFLAKPANGLIFLVTYLLSEMGYALMIFWSSKTKEIRLQRLRNWRISAGWKLLGFIPVFGLAWLCGGAQAILRLIDQNEVHELATPLAEGGLLRLFYFPLCLSACYHLLLLGGLWVAAMVASRWLSAAKTVDASPPIPFQLIIPIAVAYLIYGEFFSFWMLVKTVRALLLMLPLFWLGFFWWWEKRRFQLGPLFLAAVVYASLAFSQKAFNLLGTREHLVEDNYPLTWASWTEMPSAWRWGWSLDKTICSFIERDLPASGVICVNAIEIRNALAWQLGSRALLEGKVSPYEVRNLFNYKGEYDDHALLQANRIALITFFPVQSSRAAWLRSMGILGYGQDAWCGQNAFAEVREMPSIRQEPIGYEFVFQRPLTQVEVDRANQSVPFVGMPRSERDVEYESLYGRHYSREEAWNLLQQWAERRFR